MFRLEGYIQDQIFGAALDHLQRRHPKLRAEVIRGQDRRLCYNFSGAAQPLRFEVKDYDGKECHWREEARRLLQIPISAVGPFVAFSVLKNRELNRSVLVMSGHHAIVDGMSAMMLVDDLLTEYARLDAQSSEGARPPLQPVSVARAQEAAGWKDRWWLLRRFMRLRIEERRARQTALPESSSLQPVPQWEHWVFSPEETFLLMQRCRQEKVSLAGALVSAVYCGLMNCMPASEAWFKSQIPFSLRESAEGPAGKVSAYDVGCFVSQMNEFHCVAKPLDYWGLARFTRNSILGFVNKGGPALCYNLTAMAERKLFTQSAAKVTPPAGERPTLLVTNYGTVRMGETYGSLRMQEAMTTFNTFPDGPSLAMAALTMGERLNVVFAAGNLEPAFWHLLRDEVRGHLDAIIKPALEDKISNCT